MGQPTEAYVGEKNTCTKCGSRSIRKYLLLRIYMVSVIFCWWQNFRRSRAFVCSIASLCVPTRLSSHRASSCRWHMTYLQMWPARTGEPRAGPPPRPPPLGFRRAGRLQATARGPGRWVPKRVGGHVWCARSSATSGVAERSSLLPLSSRRVLACRSMPAFRWLSSCLFLVILCEFLADIYRRRGFPCWRRHGLLLLRGERGRTRGGGRMSAESSLGLPVPFRVLTPAAFLAWCGTALLRFSSRYPGKTRFS